MESAASGARIVVVGDAEWVNNSRLTLLFNEDLALSMVGWLTGGDDDLLFDLDPNTGVLTFTGASVLVPTPICVLFGSPGK